MLIHLIPEGSYQIEFLKIYFKDESRFCFNLDYYFIFLLKIQGFMFYRIYTFYMFYCFSALENNNDEIKRPTGETT